MVARAGGSLIDRRFTLPHSYTAFAEDGRLAEPEQESALGTLLAELAAAAADRRDAPVVA